MRAYLDTCCLNRPFDDQSLPRIRRETARLVAIHRAFARGEHTWVTSAIVEDEILATRDPHKREILLAQLDAADVWLDANERTVRLARLLHEKGLGEYDALHMAVAFVGRCDVLLTTDDRLIRRASLLLACPY